jgi:hypothetical protein
MTKRALLLSVVLVLSSAASLAAQAAARPADILGKWEFTVETPQGQNMMTVTFARVDGVLGGQGEGEFGAFPVVDVIQAGSDLTFSLRFEQNGQTFDIPFKGKLTGAAAEGTLTFAMNAESQTMAWKAKKLPPS